MVLKECPHCHKLFASQLMSREQIDSSELAKTPDFPDMRWTTGGRWIPRRFTPLKEKLPGPDAVAAHPETIIAYKLTYSCKNCGKEWTRVSVEEIPIPRSYVKSEEERTEYDAEKEAKEAREQEYAR